MQKKKERPLQKQGMRKMDNTELKDLFNKVFNNELGKLVIEHLERIYDVSSNPMSADKEYVKTCQRSVCKYIRSMANMKQ